MNSAIGKLLDQNGDTLLGTAFAVSASHAFTAFHCIGNTDTGEVMRKRVLLEFLTGVRLVANFEAGSHVEDYAILLLQPTLPDSLVPVLLLDKVIPNEPFRAAGYPVSIYGSDNTHRPDIYIIGGSVRAVDTSLFGGIPAIQLFSDEGGAGQSLHGMSGGPVLVGQNFEGAIGLVRWNIPRKDAPALGAGASFWACPIKLIIDKQSGYRDLVLHVRELASDFRSATIFIQSTQQHSPHESEVKLARKVIRFLEDRRVLYNPYELEPRADWVIESVLQIRKFLSDEIMGEIDDDTDLAKHLKAIRAACRQFLDSQQSSYVRGHRDVSFFLPLGELRSAVGRRIGMIAMLYGIEVEGELASIIPSPTND